MNWRSIDNLQASHHNVPLLLRIVRRHESDEYVCVKTDGVLCYCYNSGDYLYDMEMLRKTTDGIYFADIREILM